MVKDIPPHPTFIISDTGMACFMGFLGGVSEIKHRRLCCACLARRISANVGVTVQTVTEGNEWERQWENNHGPDQTMTRILAFLLQKMKNN